MWQCFNWCIGEISVQGLVYEESNSNKLVVSIRSIIRFWMLIKFIEGTNMHRFNEDGTIRSFEKDERKIL